MKKLPSRVAMIAHRHPVGSFAAIALLALAGCGADHRPVTTSPPASGEPHEQPACPEAGKPDIRCP